MPFWREQAAVLSFTVNKAEKYTRLAYLCAYTGGEAVSSETDSDSGKGMMTSYDSVSSLNSTSTNMSSTGPGPGQPPTLENLEQFEVRKQQKDIWENGIEMWVLCWIIKYQLLHFLCCD